MFLIVGDVALKFLFPEGLIAFWGRGVFTPFVPVPETAVYEDDGFIFRQNDVRLTRQGTDVFAEAVSGAVQHGADEDFRFGVFSPDFTHVPASFVWSQVIHEEITPRNTPNTQKFYHPLSLEGPEKYGGEK